MAFSICIYSSWGFEIYLSSDEIEALCLETGWKAELTELIKWLAVIVVAPVLVVTVLFMQQLFLFCSELLENRFNRFNYSSSALDSSTYVFNFTSRVLLLLVRLDSSPLKSVRNIFIYSKVKPASNYSSSLSSSRALSITSSITLLSLPLGVALVII